MMDEEKKGTPGDNVKSFQEEKEKRQRRTVNPAPSAKAPKASFYRAIADAIDRHALAQTMPLFPERYVIYRPTNTGAVLAHRSDDDVLTLIENFLPLDKAIMAYINADLAARPEYRFSAREVKETRDFWALHTPGLPAEDVRPVSWKSETGLTLNRLPWDPCRDDTATLWPTWERLLSRLTNREAFIHWIGSLFFQQSDIQQYVWLYGPGGDGKGSINRFLGKIFGRTYCSKQPPPRGDAARFWTYGIIGKRLVVLPDCNSSSFPSSGLFKSLTGGDPIDVECKGMMSFTYNHFAKFMIISNERPKLSSEKADIRRVIYCEFPDEHVEIDPDFEQKLWEEGGAFLGTAMAQYLETCPRHGQIPVDPAEMEKVIAQNEEEFEVVYARFFVKPAITELQLYDLTPEQLAEVTVTPDRMQTILSVYWKSNIQKGEFFKWLEHKFKARKRRLHHGAPWIYVNVAERSTTRGRDPREV